jgi:sulfur relay (sulfurtransferase) complex TusBCD TusD component (DsrE family)
MSNVLHEVINSGQPWAAERAQMALQIAEALQNKQIHPDEAKALLEDLVNTEKLEADGADIQLRAALVFGVTQVLSMC